MFVPTTPFRYHGDDGTALAGFRWAADGAKPRAILQLAHGAGEHSGRYYGPLQPVIAAGFVVYAADHRGHGLTSGMSHLGDFGPGGAPACVADMAALARLARAENPGVPLILMGHSMGAMLAQAFLLEHSGLIDGLVLSGTAAAGKALPPVPLRGPAPLASQATPRGGGSAPNSVYANPRTDYDWLSRDPAEVDRYIADPFCGIRFTEASRASFMSLREREATPAALAGVKAGLPVYVFVGDADPINDELRAVTPLVEAYRAAGLDVTFKVYPGGRHEMLNEVNRDEVVADLLAWLSAQV